MEPEGPEILNRSFRNDAAASRAVVPFAGADRGGEGGEEFADRCIDLALRGRFGEVAGLLDGAEGLDAGDRRRIEKLVDVLGGGRVAAVGAEGGLPFERLGPYRLVRKLGQGGMGVVYLAEQEPLGRAVALKVIRPEAAPSSRARARFEREARVVARLRHGSVVTVHDAGTEGDIAYLAMELVPGLGLDERIAEARTSGAALPAREALALCRDVARALAAAHGAGVVHRDVKPSNIRVTPEGRAMLLDFGLALDAKDGALSRSGEFHGTPDYASPEQIAGGAVDGRTDVWSLGVTLFEALTTKLPFAAPTAHGVLARIATHEPPAVGTLVRGLPRDIGVVVAKALEKDPSRRYSSAAAFADDLDALLELRPILARPVGPATRLVKWCRRRPSQAAVVAFGVALSVGVPLVYRIVREGHRAAIAVERERTAEERRSAGAEREVADDERRRAEAVSDFLIKSLEEVQFQLVYGQDVPHLRSLVGEAEQRLWRGELAPAPGAAVRLSAVLGHTYVTLAEYDRAEALLDRAIAAARELYGGAHEDLALALYARARAHLGRDELAEAEEFARAALAAWLELHDESHIDVARAELGISSVLQRRGRFVEALALNRAGLARLAELGVEGGAVELAAQNNLGVLLRATGDLEGARIELLRARALHGERQIPLGPDLVDIVYNLGDVELAAGRLGPAEELLREAFDLRLRLSNRDHPQRATIEARLGAVLTRRGKHEEARERLESALAMRRRLFPGDHGDVASSLNDLSMFLRSRREDAAVEGLQREALGMLRRLHGGRDHGHVAGAEANLGSTLRRLRRLDEAEAHMRAGLEMHERLFPGGHPASASGHNNLASLLRELGRLEAALEHFERAVATRRLLYPKGHSELATSLSNLGLTLRDLGRPDEAEAAYVEALEMLQGLAEVPDGRIATTHRLVGELLLERGRPAEALPHLEAAAAIFGRIPDPNRRTLAKCFELVGEARWQSGEREAALGAFEEGLEIARRIGKPDEELLVRLGRRLVGLYGLLDAGAAEPRYGPAIDALRAEFGP